MDTKIDKVKTFYAMHKGSGIFYAVQLYRDYLSVTPKRKQVSLRYFVRWAPNWVNKQRERTSLGGGVWFWHTKLNLGEMTCAQKLLLRCLAHRK